MLALDANGQMGAPGSDLGVGQSQRSGADGYPLPLKLESETSRDTRKILEGEVREILRFLTLYYPKRPTSSSAMQGRLAKTCSSSTFITRP